MPEMLCICFICAAYLPNKEVKNSQNAWNEEGDGEPHARDIFSQVGLPPCEDTDALQKYEKAQQDQLSGECSVGKWQH